MSLFFLLDANDSLGFFDFMIFTEVKDVDKKIMKHMMLMQANNAFPHCN